MNKDLRLRDILADDNKENKEKNIKVYALESFAKEIDSCIQTDMLRKLILDHASISKRLEEANKELSYNQEMLIDAQNIAKLGRWDIYVKDGYLKWTESLYDILEIDKDKVPEYDLFMKKVHPDDLEMVEEENNKLLTRKKPWTVRYRLLMDDGRIKWVYLRLNPVLDKKNQLMHYFGTIQDITEMKKIEDELDRYNHHLEQIVEEKIKEISESQMATIYALIKLSESRDDDTGAHIERTASFCRLLAKKARNNKKYKYEITDKFTETIYSASPLHDIGKVGTPDNILLKPGKLTDEEFKIMKNHVQIGYDTLSKIGQQYDKNDFLKMGMDIALYHHEKWDGNGYLKGLSGEEIPLSARIMAIADVYDALRSKRVYKEAFSHEKSVDIITQGKGSHFDPDLIDIFLGNQDEFREMFDEINSKK